MPDRYIEKSFLLLMVASLLLHIGGFAALYYWPQDRSDAPKEPVFIDLQQMPELKPPARPRQQEARRRAERQVQVERETAPRGRSARDSQPPVTQTTPPREQRALSPVKPSLPVAVDRKTPQVLPGSSVSSLLKPRIQDHTLFPKANKLARLEETYRSKFEANTPEGESRLLNSNETRLLSFSKRLDTAIYGVWRIPEGATKPGDVLVLTTFNSRTGEIIRVKLIESSGDNILDEEIFRTLKAIGPLGPLPKEYNKPEYDMFLMFSYYNTHMKMIK